MGIELVRQAALQALLPPPALPLAEWIEANVSLPASGSAGAGLVLAIYGVIAILVGLQGLVTPN